MYYLGIDIGTSSVKLAALDGREAVFTAYARHGGSPRASLARLLDDLDGHLGLATCAGWVACGSRARELEAFAEGSGGARSRVLLLEDVPALVSGVRLLAPEAASIIEMGGQAAHYVTGLQQAGAPRFAMNESCAAGTGSFFEDQMGRLGLRIEDYSALVEGAHSVPRLSGRCAVFAKTDIIHRQQEGVPVEDILLGLCFATVKSFKATIVRSLPRTAPFALAGGVALNAGVVRAVREVFELGEGELLTGPEFVYAQAIGAALEAAAGRGALARESDEETEREAHGHGPDGSKGAVLPLVDLHARIGRSAAPSGDDLVRLPALQTPRNVSGAGFSLRRDPWPQDASGKTPCYLGVDVGSTSTNLVLVSEEGDLLDAQYLRTRGDAKRAVREGLASLGERLGSRVEVRGVATTGSGRTLIGDFIGADVVRDEITAQARAAAAADPLVDTVFEIGGQDSKYISLNAGQVSDFQMNKVCAAGTGSFVEEQAARLDIPLDRFGELALSARSPVDLGERCTVFVETAIAAALAKGASHADVAAGLCLSIVRNYLHKVVGTRPVGQHVVLQGGVAYNPGIVAAFEALCGERLTVSPWFAVSGAVGAALLAREAASETTRFRGFDLRGARTVRRAASSAQIAVALERFRRTQALLTEGYDGVLDPSKKTVGIPRALLMYKFFPMANAFFRELGFNVLFTGPTDEAVVGLAQESSQGEVCFPVKLVHGHMRQLLEAGVDYVFMPRVHTIRHVKSHVAHNYACPYMQTAPLLTAQELGFEERGVKLLSPVLDLDFGQQSLAEAMIGTGAELGFGPRESSRALMAGGFAIRELDRKTEEIGDELFASLGDGERVLVLVTRQYGSLDATLNGGIPELLIERGERVVTLSNLHAHNCDIEADHPGLCWPFGQHIIGGAKMIRRDPRLFMVYLVNHGCGPDTMMSHLVAEEMGDKPYLQIEIDEHYSKVGIVTRIEAFLNALDHYTARAEDAALPQNTKHYRGLDAPLDRARRIVFPDLGFHSLFAARSLRERGFDVLLAAPDAHAVARGHDGALTKEYLTFSAFLGLALTAVERETSSEDRGAADEERLARAGGSEGGGVRAHGAETAIAVAVERTDDAATGSQGCGLQVLVPSSVGAEADAVYDRVVRGALDAAGMDDVAVVGRRLERLPWVVEDAESLFCALLAGDVVYAAPPEARPFVLDILQAGELTFDRVLSAAAAASRAPQTPEQRCIAVVGEWPCVFSDDLAAGTWASLESQGYRLARMPLSEYLWFLWSEAAEDDRVDRPLTPFLMDGLSSDEAAALPPSRDFSNGPGFEEKQAVLRSFAARMDEVAARLGARSTFTVDRAALPEAADEAGLARFRGANGRYRYAAARLAAAGADGVITVASMYENTQLLLGLSDAARPSGAPLLNLAFDGALDQGIDERLRSFLYYL